MSRIIYMFFFGLLLTSCSSHFFGKSTPDLQEFETFGDFDDHIQAESEESGGYTWLK